VIGKSLQEAGDNIIRFRLVEELGEDIRVVVLPSGQDFILGPEIINPTR